jgi:hypothetical protein
MVQENRMVSIKAGHNKGKCLKPPHALDLRADALLASDLGI